MVSDLWASQTLLSPLEALPVSIRGRQSFLLDSRNECWPALPR